MFALTWRLVLHLCKVEISSFELLAQLALLKLRCRCMETSMLHSVALAWCDSQVAFAANDKATF